MTTAGIELATFRFVAQHLNHCATAVPRVTGINLILGCLGLTAGRDTQRKISDPCRESNSSSPSRVTTPTALPPLPVLHWEPVTGLSFIVPRDEDVEEDTRGWQECKNSKVQYIWSDRCCRCKKKSLREWNRTKHAMKVNVDGNKKYWWRWLRTLPSSWKWCQAVWLLLTTSTSEIPVQLLQATWVSFWSLESLYECVNLF